MLYEVSMFFKFYVNSSTLILLESSSSIYQSCLRIHVDRAKKLDALHKDEAFLSQSHP